MSGTELRDPARVSRGTWPLRDYPSVGWLLAAIVVLVIQRSIASAEWLLVHLVFLGALSHAVIVWSFHFTETLLRSPATLAARRGQNWRIGLLLGAGLAVVIGVPIGFWPLVLLGATLAAVAVGWHGWTLARMLRSSLPGRFRITIRYYLAAVASLTIGAALGATLALGLPGEWHGRLLIGHTMANLLGWIGFTVTGTLVTFWPTILRTRMDERAERFARQAFPVLIAGLAVLIAGALLGIRPLAFVGLVGYLAGIAWWARALWRPMRASPPREFAPASVGASLVWALAGLAWVVVLLATTADWTQVAARFRPIALVFALGMAAQLLIGALSHLIPAVLGGGPGVVRAAAAWFNKGATIRLVVTNAALLLMVLPVPPLVRWTVGALGVLAFASFIPLLFRAVRAGIAARTPAEHGTLPPKDTPKAGWSSGQLVAGLAALAIAVSLGVGMDPAAAGLTPLSSPWGISTSAQPTGEVVRLTVHARGMTFVPNQVTVNPGDQLVIELVNDDPTTTHDLSIAGRTTPRLAPGERAELDVGVINNSVQGWCTIAGHRQMGMVFDVIVAGDSQPSPHSEHGTTAEPPIVIDPDAKLAAQVDPVLAPLSDERVHRITLTVEEVALEVAPGIWQQRWTYNGSSVGPTLHGRVGDVFEVTLVNNGTMGHSIDFHAGELAPDEPMRTIPPGESLVYRFTANRAGIWMYHCSTMPMSAHIAAGMHGAVVIEPDGLPEVDRSYVLVQSEVYLTSPATSRDEATEVDASQVATKQPDLVGFNGVAFQYDQFPLAARVGERVRFWVLAAGPNLGTSFHIVGGQFDTVYFEGGYQLRGGVDAFGEAGGGSQALGLLPAQGGFVEIVFPEAGNYPVVNHTMSDAERGAHGIVHVTD